MNIQTPSLTLARAFTLVAMTAGMASAALAQQANTSTGGSSGVTNMSAPRSVAPVSATPAPVAAPAAAAQAAVTQAPSNTSLNPARSTGVVFFAETNALSQLWLFWLAPMLGAVIGALAWTVIGEGD